MGLIANSDVKDFLGITATDHDVRLTALAAVAQADAEKYCDRKLEGQALTEYYDGNGTSLLQLRNYPIKSITSIHDDLDREYNADDLISSDDYALDTDFGIVELVGLTFGKGSKNIKIVYNAGYSGVGYAALPADLKQAIVYLAAAMFLEGLAGVNVIEAQEIVYRPGYLKKEAYKILDRYRRIFS